MLWRCTKCRATGISYAVGVTIEDCEIEHALDGLCNGRVEEECPPPPPREAYAKCARCNQPVRGVEMSRSRGGSVEFEWRCHGEKARAVVDVCELEHALMRGPAKRTAMFSDVFGERAPRLLMLIRY
jgi:hypothetical protein